MKPFGKNGFPSMDGYLSTFEPTFLQMGTCSKQPETTMGLVFGKLRGGLGVKSGKKCW